MPKRVVITSMGVMSSLGRTAEDIMARLNKGHVDFERPSYDREVAVCPIRNFDVKKITGRFKNVRYLNRGAQFCVASAMAAIGDVSITKGMLEKAGLFVGTGPNLDIGGECPEIREGEFYGETLKALWILRFLPNTATSIISSLAGIHGENSTLNTACTASLQAIGDAFRKIKDGYLCMAIAGGGDSRLSHGGILAYKKAKALFSTTSDPEKEYGPFDENRRGFMPGEGGAFFLLEEMEHARKRGAEIHGEICGYGNSMDGYNMTAPDPDGRWAEKAVIGALKEAHMSPDEIDMVSAHGTGTPLNDAMEAGLINRIYTDGDPKVIGLKSWIGHLAAACGAVELAICLVCMRNDYIPQIRNLNEPCHPRVDFVRKPMAYSPSTVMIENFGFGGQNAALVLRKWAE